MRSNTIRAILLVILTGLAVLALLLLGLAITAMRTFGQSINIGATIQSSAGSTPAPYSPPGALDPSVAGGIIGGIIDSANGAAKLIPFKNNAALPATPFWPVTDRFLVYGVALCLESAQVQGALGETYWGRMSTGGTTSVQPAVADNVTTTPPGAPQGCSQDSQSPTMFSTGETPYINQDVGGITNSKTGGWSTEVRGLSYQPFGAEINVATSNAVPRYTMVMDGGDSADENTQVVVMPQAGNWKFICVRTTTTQPGTGSLVVNLRKNLTTDTTMSVSIPAGALAGPYCDFVTGDAVAVAAKDKFTFKRVDNAATNSATIMSITAGFYPTTAGQAVLVFPNPQINNFSVSQNRFMPAFSAGSLTVAEIQSPMPRTGHAHDFNCYEAAVSGSGSNPVTATVFGQGISAGLTASIPAAAVGTVVGSGTHVFSYLDGFSIQYSTGDATPQVSSCSFALDAS